jgi:hypothetical protein
VAIVYEEDDAQEVDEQWTNEPMNTKKNNNPTQSWNPKTKKNNEMMKMHYIFLFDKYNT